MSQIPGYEAFARAECYSVMISTNPRMPGVKMKAWPEEHGRYMDLDRAFPFFAAARSLYYLQNNLTPPPRVPVTLVPRTTTLLSVSA